MHIDVHLARQSWVLDSYQVVLCRITSYGVICRPREDLHIYNEPGALGAVWWILVVFGRSTHPMSLARAAAYLR